MPLGCAIIPRMKTAEFVLRVRDTVRGLLPPDGRAYTLRQWGHQLQLHYGVPRLHYEVWVDHRYSHIEVGLHFEADATTNLRLLRHFDRRLIEIRAETALPVETEHWTASWARVHHVIPFERLDAPLADEVAHSLAQLVEVLQPMLEEGMEAGVTRAD